MISLRATALSALWCQCGVPVIGSPSRGGLTDDRYSHTHQRSIWLGTHLRHIDVTTILSWLLWHRDSLGVGPGSTGTVKLIASHLIYGDPGTS